MFPWLPYILFGYFCNKVAQGMGLAPGQNLSERLLAVGDEIHAAFSRPLPSLNSTDLLIGIAGALFLRLAVYTRSQNVKKYRHGVEYGSARWGTTADIAPFIDPDFFQNIPMTMTERLTMVSRPKQPKYARNKNILVIGGSGSGKTRFFCKPSLLQAHSSYVVTDPKGTLLPEVGTFLQRKKYRIKCLNLINFKKSMKYNPLAYIRSEKDILKLVNALILNTKGEGEKSGEDFWVKAERLYYCALIGYIWYLLLSIHVRSMDQNEAIKTVKRKITDIDSMKIDAQKRAAREGFDMDIIPTDIATYAGEAKNILRDLQSRNERMFLVTFLLVNMADSKRKLDNDITRASSVAQKYNCQLTRLDFQQEQGFVSALPLGVNQIKIQRGLTTSALAVLVCDKSADFLGAGFIRVDGDVPALHGFAGIGLFVEPDQTLLLIEPGIHGGFTSFYRHIVEAQFCQPVIVLRGQLHNGIPP